TLQVLTERFSRIGVPVFLADVKGDLAGLAVAGAMSPKLSERLTAIKADAPAFAAAPAVFWDVYGASGHPVRATVSDLGPLLLAQTAGGRGVVNVLAADQLIKAPKLYSTFLLWLLSELYEHLPEVGDPEKPAIVFFFDEAHLLFADAPGVLLEKIEQVVRLIRSKGVGVYFVTQNPLDVPETVLGQLGNRVQHALRAFTPRDQKAVKAAAETMRANPKVDTEKAIQDLGVGEALISFLDEKGRPGMVERA